MNEYEKDKNILSNQNGSIIITFALVINILILAVALSLDMGRAYMAKSAISGASDAAAIASAVNEGDAAKAQVYFETNLPSGALGIDYDYNQDVQHLIDPTTGDVSVITSDFDVSAYLSSGTNNSGVFQLGDVAVVGTPSSVPAPADIVIIMDASGSMGHNPKISGGDVTSYNPITINYGQDVYKYQALEAAVLSFFEVIFPNQAIGSDGLPLFRISLKSYDSGLRGNYPFSGDLQQLVSYFPNVINPGSSTNAGVALEAGRGELANSPSGRRNIYIFLTDGQLNKPNNGSWQWPPDYTGAPANSIPHKYAASECYDIKLDPDVDFWTIGFGAAANSGLNKDVLEYCATIPSQYVTPTNGDELTAIFTQVANQVTRVRIKK